MAMRRRVEEEEDVDINITPMLDVVFILLIFFIVTATFVKTPGAPISKVDIKSVEPLNSQIIVALTDTDEIWIDRRQVQMREIYAIMQDMISDNPAAEAMIQVDADSRNGPLQELMAAMQDAGITKIDVSTENEN